VGRPRVGKVLSVTLALPEPTEEEVLYKKGVPSSTLYDVTNLSS
jgi:hypothetical protein